MQMRYLSFCVLRPKAEEQKRSSRCEARKLLSFRFSVQYDVTVRCAVATTRLETASTSSTTNATRTTPLCTTRRSAKRFLLVTSRTVVATTASSKTAAPITTCDSAPAIRCARQRTATSRVTTSADCTQKAIATTSSSTALDTPSTRSAIARCVAILVVQF